jgi:hypothetical protein
MGLLGIELQHLVAAWELLLIGAVGVLLFGGQLARMWAGTALVGLLLVGAAIGLPWVVSDH